MKVPSVDKFKVPFIGLKTSIAVIESLSGSSSFDKTEFVIPSFKTLIVPPFVTLIKSSTPVGASLIWDILTVNKSSTVQLILPSDDIRLT